MVKETYKGHTIEVITETKISGLWLADAKISPSAGPVHALSHATVNDRAVGYETQEEAERASLDCAKEVIDMYQS